MADTYTTNLNLTKPEPDVSLDWGTKLNSDLDTIDAIFSATGTQVDVNLNSANFGDNKKALFGASDDLQIYHSGSHSFITDSGTGSLFIGGDTETAITNAAGTEYKIRTFTDGSVSLYYDNSAKLATTSSGIDVTGTVTSDGLVHTGDTDTYIKFLSNRIYSDVGGNRLLDLQPSTSELNSIGSVEFNTGASLLKRLNVSSGGDISFYEDTGTTAKLFWDASAERLGIGTTSPSNPLHVYHATTDTVANFESGDASLAVNFTASDNSMQITTSGTDGIIKNNGAGNFRLFNNGSERVRITSSGNVGIGTTGPSSALDVTGTVLATRAEFGGIEASADRPLMVKTDTDNFALHIEENSGSENWQIGVNADGDLGFHNSATAAASVTFNDSGNVGIGTSNPAHLLHLSAADPRIQLTDTTTNVDHIINANSSVGNLTIDVDANAEGSGPNLIIDIANSERMRITSSGNVGIGTTSPGRALHVSTADNLPIFAESTDGLCLLGLGDDSGSVALAASGNQFAVYTGGGVGSGTGFGTEKMRITSSGNVGIGTSSPNYTLQVHKPSDSTVRFQITNSNTGSGTADGFQIIQNGSSQSNKVNLLNYENSALGIWTNNAERLHITASGNVGIGTTSPDSILHIASETNGTNTFTMESLDAFLSVGQVANAINFNTNDGSATGVTSKIAQISENGNEDLALAFSTFNGTLNEAMRIDSSGNLLVGTTDTDPSNNASGTGVAISSDGRIFTGGLSASQFNRIGSDGNIVNFRKDGTTVGSIGTGGGSLDVYSSGASRVGLRLAQAVIPMLNGSTSPSTVDLGTSTREFKDLYLSGGVYVGGTAAANQLDDYEEGTWTATLPQGGNAIFQANTYTKVGRLVTVYCQFRGNSTPNNSNTFQVGNLPFAAAAGSQYGSVSCARGFPSVAKSIVAYCTGSVFQFRAVPHNSSGGGLGDLLNSDLTGYTNDFDISFAVTYMTSS